jgi:hypothetical protein
LTPAWEGSGTGLATVRSPVLAPTAHNAAEPFWTTSKYGLRLVGPVDMSFIAGRWGDCRLGLLARGNGLPAELTFGPHFPPSPSPNEVFCASAIFALVAALFFRFPALPQNKNGEESSSTLPHCRVVVLSCLCLRCQAPKQAAVPAPQK